MKPMNASATTATGVAMSAPTGIPAQRSSDAFVTAYATVHELGIALQRAARGADELRPTT